jgi:hypothetical protein
VKTEDIEIFPNPATDQLQIRYHTEQLTGITITNSIGQLMLQQPIHNELTTLNVKELPAGIYIITLNRKAGNTIHKFVKN